MSLFEDIYMVIDLSFGKFKLINNEFLMRNVPTYSFTVIDFRKLLIIIENWHSRSVVINWRENCFESENKFFSLLWCIDA